MPNREKTEVFFFGSPKGGIEKKTFDVGRGDVELTTAVPSVKESEAKLLVNPNAVHAIHFTDGGGD